MCLPQVKRLKKTGGDLMPYNIVPLDAPSPTNAIGFYPEVSYMTTVAIAFYISQCCCNVL